MWFELLQQAVNASSANKVAAKLGISPTMVSVVLSDSYPASTANIEKLVMQHLGRWLTYLREAVEATSGNKVAAKLGISPATVSQVLNGKYQADTARIEALVIYHLGRWECPLIGSSIDAASCRQQRNRRVPTSNPEDIRAWAFCQSKCEYTRKETQHG